MKKHRQTAEPLWDLKHRIKIEIGRPLKGDMWGYLSLQPWDQKWVSLRGRLSDQLRGFRGMDYEET